VKFLRNSVKRLGVSAHSQKGKIVVSRGRNIPGTQKGTSGPVDLFGLHCPRNLSPSTVLSLTAAWTLPLATVDARQNDLISLAEYRARQEQIYLVTQRTKVIANPVFDTFPPHSTCSPQYEGITV
jgi:hypothetical protein